MIPEITIVSIDDWQGLYVDGQLMSEGHRITFYDLLQAVPALPITERALDGTDLDRHMSETGVGFPAKLKDVPSA